MRPRLYILFACLCFAPGVAWGQSTTPDAPALPATERPSDPVRSLPQRLAEIDMAMSQVRDLRADFVESKHSALLKKPLVSKGSLLVRDGRVRWDTAVPHRSIMTVAGGELRLYYPDGAVVEIYPIESELGRLAMTPLPRLSAFQDRFDITEADASVFGGEEPLDASRFVAIQLAPRSIDLKQHLASVSVLVDTRVPCISMVVMTDPDGERTEITFANVRVNTGVKDSELDFKTPQGARESRPLGSSPVRRSKGPGD